jgi:hypothetical protein
MWEPCVADQIIVEHIHTLYYLAKIIALPNKYQYFA